MEKDACRNEFYGKHFDMYFGVSVLFSHFCNKSIKFAMVLLITGRKIRFRISNFERIVHVKIPKIQKLS